MKLYYIYSSSGKVFNGATSTSSKVRRLFEKLFTKFGNKSESSVTQLNSNQFKENEIETKGLPQYEATSGGLNFYAAFFGGVWCLYHRFWLLGLSLIYLPILLAKVSFHASLLVEGFIFAYLLIFGNDMIRTSLEKKQYKLIGVKVSKNADQAILDYLK